MEKDLADAIENAKEVIGNATEVLDRMTRRLGRASALLREWRDKYGGLAVHVFPSVSHRLTASPSDLLVETQRFLEGR